MTRIDDREGSRFKQDEELPVIQWVKNDPEKYKCFTDGSVFLVALRVDNKTSVRWEFDVVEVDCDGDGAHLYYREKSEPYTSWAWEDFEYFCLLEGEMPTSERESEDE